MADLGTFARRMRDRAKRVETNLNKRVVAIAAAVNQTVVLATPVDTGRARGNWQLSLGHSINLEIDREDKPGAATIASNSATVRTRRPEVDIYITNNVDYINFLNAGSSAQAPAGFVEQAVGAGIAAGLKHRIVD